MKCFVSEMVNEKFYLKQAVDHIKYRAFVNLYFESGFRKKPDQFFYIETQKHVSVQWFTLADTLIPIGINGKIFNFFLFEKI